MIMIIVVIIVTLAFFRMRVSVHQVKLAEAILRDTKMGLEVPPPKMMIMI